MEITDEEFGGKLVTLYPGDNLKSVPRTHRKLITPEIEAWWADPVRAVRTVSERAVTPNMGEWFRRMAEDGGWRLELHMSDVKSYYRASYRLSCTGIRGAEVCPPPAKPVVKHLPPGLAEYSRLIGYVDWMGFGAAGGFGGHGDHMPLSALNCNYHGADVDLARTRVIGCSPCGDMIIYTADDRGGWFNLGSHEICLLGSVLDTINWVYGELLANRFPDYFYAR